MITFTFRPMRLTLRRAPPVVVPIASLASIWTKALDPRRYRSCHDGWTDGSTMPPIDVVADWIDPPTPTERATLARADIVGDDIAAVDWPTVRYPRLDLHDGNHRLSSARDVGVPRVPVSLQYDPTVIEMFPGSLAARFIEMVFFLRARGQA